MVETADKIFVVMELVQGGELFEYLLDRGPLPEAAAVHIMRQVRLNPKPERSSASLQQASLGPRHLSPHNIPHKTTDTCTYR